MRPHFFLAPALLASAPLLALAQSTCNSDGQPQPRVLYERFISADCDSCWASAPAHVPGASTLVVDWIVPGRLGDEAPLAAAATRDALERLKALQRPVPQATDTAINEVSPPAPATGRLRVARGPAVNDYVSNGIHLTQRARTVRKSDAPPLSYPFTLLLVEHIPAGTEGSPVARHLVRNALFGTWSPRDARPAPAGQLRWMENRPMRIPEGAQTERLGVVGWLQDGSGAVVAAAQSQCRATRP